MPVCQSVPEGIFQNNLHFIVFTRSKQYRHMENCASKPIPVLTRLPFFLGQVITSFSHALPLPASACQMCSVLWGPVPGTGHNPFRGPTRSPLVLLLNYSSSMNLLATWGFVSKKINNQKKKKLVWLRFWSWTESGRSWVSANGYHSLSWLCKVKAIGDQKGFVSKLMKTKFGVN